jgi:hypothetical protein
LQTRTADAIMGAVPRRPRVEGRSRGERSRSVPVTELSWYWIALELTATPLLGLLVAFPFWRKGGMIFGNIAGTAVIFGSAFALIFREHVELERIVQGCFAQGAVCWPEPSAFTRFAIYAFIALIEVCCLFSLSLVVEKRLRDRDYAPEWR